MKKYLLLAVPPGIVILAKKASKLLRRMQSSSGQQLVASYDDDGLTAMVVEKNRIFRDKIETSRSIDLGAVRTILGVCLSGIDRRGGELNILDLGGGGGYHYFIARLILPSSVKINWHVVETESMVRSAAPLAGSDIQFYSSIREAASAAGQLDLILASSSLQYFADQDEIIEEMLSAGSRHIFVTRTPFTLSQSITGEIQQSLFSSNGPGPLPAGYEDKIIEYPIHIMNRNAFLNRFSERYDLKFSIVEESPGFIINGRSFDNYGFYFTVK